MKCMINLLIIKKNHSSLSNEIKDSVNHMITSQLNFYHTSFNTFVILPLSPAN